MPEGSSTNYVIPVTLQSLVEKLKAIFKGGELLFVMCLLYMFSGKIHLQGFFVFVFNGDV